ncbi:MAG: energy transducer TonB [Kofleriaceae bacterium]|nr:energy transducer TonB [Kofleriaceae bacterium]
MARALRRLHRRRRVWLAAAVGAVAVHGAGLIGYDAVREPDLRLRWPAAIGPGGDVDDEPVAVADYQPVELLATDPASATAAAPPAAVQGVGDAASATGESPMPRASADLPGARAADRGGGDVGGPTTWTGRRDDPEDAALRAQVWSDPRAYRAPRADTGRREASPEAVSRAPERTYGDRQVRELARDGADAARPSAAADGPGAGATAGASWRDADPVFDAAAGRPVPARRDGATRPATEAAMVDPGAAAVDVTRRGAAGADVAVAAASDQRQPDPYDLTPARAGGRAGEGVRGRRAADGAVADGRGRGRGTGASRAALAEGDGGAATWASRTDPYLRDLLRRLDREVVFPHDLALDMRSGRSIATLQLHADGRVSDITIVTSSGFAGFDAELRRALGAIGDLGPVPARLLDGRASLRVMVPYTFRNPVIE